LRERDVEGGGVARDACPVTFPREQHAVGDAQRGEHAPAGEQAYLSGSEGGIRGELDLIVVENVAVEHYIILLWGGGGARLRS
jgi:hypothetical protein